MKVDPAILTEINEISPLLASVQGVNVFKAPDGYFASLAEDIRETVMIPELSDLKRETNNPQSVPEGYFEDLSMNILKKIREQENVFEEDAVFYPSLSQCKGKNVYTVPDRYFDVFPGRMISLIRQEPRGRVVPLFKRQVFRIAVAAVIAAGIFLAVFFTSDSGNNNQSFAVINKHTVPYKAALKYNSEKAFDNGIASLTDDQIIAYLLSDGDILDNDQLIRNTSVSGMPSATDYLVNDDALEQYLKTISDGKPVQNN